MIYNKNLMNSYHMWKLSYWIDKDKLIWEELSLNPNAIYLLESNPNKINWDNLSYNMSAIDLIKNE